MGENSLTNNLWLLEKDEYQFELRDYKFQNGIV